MPNVIEAFDPYGYDKPGVTRMRTDPSATSDTVSIYRRKEETEQDEAEVQVPENMMLCPGCNALNLKTADFCKTCAADLHPPVEEEETPEEEEDEEPLFHKTIEEETDSV